MERDVRIASCPHCRKITEQLRRTGDRIDAQSHHYAMALTSAARAEGVPLAQLIDWLHILERADLGEVQIVGLDVSIVHEAPANAIDAFVLGQGERVV